MILCARKPNNRSSRCSRPEAGDGFEDAQVPMPPVAPWPPTAQPGLRLLYYTMLYYTMLYHMIPNKHINQMFCRQISKIFPFSSPLE